MTFYSYFKASGRSKGLSSFLPDGTYPKGRAPSSRRGLTAVAGVHPPAPATAFSDQFYDGWTVKRETWWRYA